MGETWQSSSYRVEDVAPGPSGNMQSSIGLPLHSPTACQWLTLTFSSLNNSKMLLPHPLSVCPGPASPESFPQSPLPGLQAAILALSDVPSPTAARDIPET